MRGWHCTVCEGVVWWVKEELYHALLARDIPHYYVSRVGSVSEDVHPYIEERLYLRAVPCCLLCDREFYDDGQHWNYMMCPPCAKDMGLRIANTLHWVDKYPLPVAINIVGFLLRRGPALGVQGES